MPYFFSIAVAVASIVLPASAVFADDFVFRGKPSEFEDYGYLVRGAAWPLKDGKPPIIFVCWEEASSDTSRERGWIQDQIENTWQRHTAVTFKGWQLCAPKNAGIHIVFKDEGARVEAFGKHLDGMKNGMVLNITFRNWSTGCQSRREECIRSIAAHEFGHALGFAHEQNRPDTPGECAAEHGQDQPSESMLTPYDPESVMNYCNSKYNNNGQLSDLDIKGAVQTYGARK